MVWGLLDRSIALFAQVYWLHATGFFRVGGGGGKNYSQKKGRPLGRPFLLLTVNGSVFKSEPAKPAGVQSPD
jgi:hypothetical protein